MSLDDRARRSAGKFRNALEETEWSARERGSIERFDRYRRRRQRGQRFSAAAIAVIVAAGALTLTFRAMGTSHDQVPADLPTPTGLIVFSETFEQGAATRFESFIVSADGSGLTRVGPPSTTVCGGNGDTWSPDGKAMLCQVFLPDLSTATATINSDGSGYTVLSSRDLPKSFGCSAWSPDGERLLCPYTSDVVYTIGRDGTGLLRLTTTSASAGPSGYTGDGSRAYFTDQGATGLRTLYSVAVDGKGRTIPLSPSDVSVQDNDYFDGVSADSSPDGSQVVFAADVTSTEKALYIVDGGGGQPHQIETADINPTSAQWSPDANWIAFAGDASTSGVSEVYLIHPDGTGSRQITSGTDGCSSYAPVWSPDSAMLLFETQCSSGPSIESTRLEVAALDGTGLSKVADLSGLTSYAWGP